MTKLEKWRSVRKRMLTTLALSVMVCVLFSTYFWGMSAGIVTFIAVLCLALDLWVTELLVSVLTGVRKANPTAILFLMVGKFLWWAALILGAKFLPNGNEKPIALGIGAFLISILVTGITHYGMPKISEIQE